jgi:hypothetical protein
MFINGGSEIWMMREDVARECNMGWKHADMTMITADGNQSDLWEVAVCVPGNVYRIMISMPIFSATS